MDTSSTQPSTQIKKAWFGAAISKANKDSAELIFNPFPKEVLDVMKPFIEKADIKRTQALGAICEATGREKYDEVMGKFLTSSLSKETTISFETELFPFRETLETLLASCCALPQATDLCFLHKIDGGKDKLMEALCSNEQHVAFQSIFDSFVRQVCVPFFASKFDALEEVYYQGFPCIRVIEPGDFSIGPHADCSYGHHPLSLNFYLFLTPARDTSALFLESKVGAEDWHPLDGNFGEVKIFPGGILSHWTTENKTEFSRVSIDFRIIAGSHFNDIKCGGSLPGGVKDVYRGNTGYYNKCVLKRQKASGVVNEKSGVQSESSSVGDGSSVEGAGCWEREGPMTMPDERTGFPFTIKDWQKYRKKKGKIKEKKKVK